MVNQLIRTFESVQRIPYKRRAKFFEILNINVSYANCIQKRDLLRESLERYRYETRCLEAIFDWRDLPIPKDILKILRKSGTLQKHHLLEVMVNGNYLKVDPTWNLELEEKGFPVTKNWDGKSNTIQISLGKIIFYDPKDQRVSFPYYPYERREFAEEFNKWIGWSY